MRLTLRKSRHGWFAGRRKKSTSAPGLLTVRDLEMSLRRSRSKSMPTPQDTHRAPAWRRSLPPRPTRVEGVGKASVAKGLRARHCIRWFGILRKEEQRDRIPGHLVHHVHVQPGEVWMCNALNRVPKSALTFRLA